MRRSIFLLGLTAIIAAPNLWGQTAVDVKRPEESHRAGGEEKSEKYRPGNSRRDYVQGG